MLDLRKQKKRNSTCAGLTDVTLSKCHKQRLAHALWPHAWTKIYTHHSNKNFTRCNTVQFSVPRKTLSITRPSESLLMSAYEPVSLKTLSQSLNTREKTFHWSVIYGNFRSNSNINNLINSDRRNVYINFLEYFCIFNEYYT